LLVAFAFVRLFVELLFEALFGDLSLKVVDLLLEHVVL
jgi:hypothetical protein